MDITNFIVTRRDDALLVGDYNSYGTQLSRRLHTLRKRLGQTTPKSKKYLSRAPLTADDIAKNPELIHLLLLSSERAWANAMHMKSVHSADSIAKGIIGSPRRHIISRLYKATTHAKQLVQVLQNLQQSQASPVALLEAKAYLASLTGTLWMEKQRWDQCLRQYSIARTIYAALGKQANGDSFRDHLSSAIDPSIRYAAYRLNLPRSKPLAAIAVQYFPLETNLRAEVESVDPDCLTEEGSDPKKIVDGATQDLPQSITWRSRTVKLEDASISQALAAAAAAESHLSSWLSEPSGRSSSSKEKGAAYDNVIIACQDAVDATKTAIDDLLSEGVDQGDKRMQSLQVTRTAVSYALIGWQVGRNRILCGQDDGLFFGQKQIKAPRKPKGGRKFPSVSEESTARQLARLRERIALYNSTLQSLDFIGELPGIIGDAQLIQELNGKRNYFQSLRCLAIGRSHAFTSHPKNALALFSRALDSASKSLPMTKTISNDLTSPPRLDVSTAQAEALCSHLEELVWQYRGIVNMQNLSSESSKVNSLSIHPLIERMDVYPSAEVDLTNLVTYPPNILPIPVKPLFLDVAWNYIDYPSGAKQTVLNGPDSREAATASKEDKKEVRRGWFGFGR